MIKGQLAAVIVDVVVYVDALVNPASERIQIERRRSPKMDAVPNPLGSSAGGNCSFDPFDMGS